MRSRRGDPRAAGLPLSHTQQTTLRTEAGEARADSLKAICYRWLRERRPEPPRSEGEEGRDRWQHLANIGTFSTALAESRPPRRGTGEQPNGGKRLPPYPMVRSFL